MDRFIVRGGEKLYGRPHIYSAKNSVLPLISASIAAGGKTAIGDCPKISDVAVMCEIVRTLGGSAGFRNGLLCLDTGNVGEWRMPCDLTKKIRASLFTVGALLARFGCASICRPGGCNIGERPIDIHIEAFRTLGVDVTESDTVTFRQNKTVGGKVRLRYPSVGATESLMIFATKLKGETVIENAASEPETVDLQNYLNLLGAKVSGAGTSTVTIEGGFPLKTENVEFLPSKDRIEAGTFLLAGVICGGEMDFYREDLKNIDATLKILSNNACKIRPKNDKILNVEFHSPKSGFGKVNAMPYPAFPTDLQPQLVACACFAGGVTVVEDRVFPDRFGYVKELVKTGADVTVRGNMCAIVGGRDIFGATMDAGDLRGGAALFLAALGAKGKSEILNVRHIDRGYCSLEETFRSLGAKAERVRL